MADQAVGKRKYHAFLSHAHVDESSADMLYSYLSKVANIRIWYDKQDLPPGATIADNLYGAIESSQAAIILLSQESVGREWVRQEFRAALDHQTHHPGYRIIPIRVDDVEPPNFLRNYSNLQLGSGEIGSATAISLLKSLYQPDDIAVRSLGAKNTYVSRSWHTDDAHLADMTCKALRSVGLQLVGDSQDQDGWNSERVGAIIDGCGAFVAILPLRDGGMRSALSHNTSKYVLQEWRIAAERDIPCLVIPEVGVNLPSEVDGLPGLVSPVVDGQKLSRFAAEVAEDWQKPKREPYVFYATDFAAAGSAIRAGVKELIEATTALPCIIGEYISGEPVQQEIIRTVVGSSLVLADISGGGPNVYIEIGAAKAAGVPVALLREGPPGRPAFMLRDQQVWDYSNDAELIGRVIRVSYPYRRSLLPY